MDDDTQGGPVDGAATTPERPEKASRRPPRRHLSVAPPLPGDAPREAPTSPRHADPGHYESALPIAAITPSHHNRDATRGLDQLAASIREKGVINPITVRPVGPDAYELVAGERRWRAAQLAGLTTIPAIVRELADVEVLEIQLIENVQREDVHPLEEADGYRRLIDMHGYTVDRIVEKTGKSKGWVYGRLKLCSLAQVPRQAFLDGKLSPTLALMIARIPTQKLQEQATRGVLGEGHWEEYQLAGIGLGTVARQHEPLNAKQAAAFIQRHFMLRLELAKFDTADRTLVPAAGACTDCVHRTGNQVELFADVAGPDVCTNPPCHDRKTLAAFNRAAEEAKERGVEVIKGKEAEGLFRQDHSGRMVLSYDATQKYFDPKDEVPYDLAPNAKKPPTWAKVLGRSLDQVPRKLVQDATGAPRELLDRAAAEKLLKKEGKVPDRPTGSSPSQDAERKRQAAMKKRRATVLAGLRTIARAQGEHFVDGTGTAAVAWWRWVARTLARTLNVEDQVLVVRAFGLGVDAKRSDALKVLEKEVDASGVLSCRGLIVAMLASVYAVGGSASSGYGPQFADACKVFGVDLKKVAAEAEQAKPKKAAPAKAKKGGRK
jgi:ParB/RepB/Spo0J family partition protein